MHSAKEVIYNELYEQYNDGKLENLSIDDISPGCGKQYKIEYYDTLSESECTIIIGTIDSFMYSLQDNRNINNPSDYFAELLKIIANPNFNKYPNVIDKPGIINTQYSRETIQLCKNCIIIIFLQEF